LGVTAQEKFPPWEASIVEGVADGLGETSSGLTGTEIGTLLAMFKIKDEIPGGTKRYRLRVALHNRQVKDKASNCVIRFIVEAMSPVRYRSDPALFTFRQDALNEVLVHVGLRVNDAGKVARGVKANTLSEAAKHAGTLRTELRRRGAHPEVLRYCTTEVLQRDWFHASLEAVKSVPDRLRAMTGAQGDGAPLFDDVLGLGTQNMPKVRINSLGSVSEQDEQKGFLNLCKGMFGMFRNPVAHDPRIARTVSDDELLELFMVVSMIHRRLDIATVRP
jgi:uncharacterized protein (TIGR02391 family)